MPGRRARVPHYTKNLALGLFNAGLVALLFAGFLVTVAAAAEHRGFGLLRWLNAPPWLAWPLAIVVFDFWQYVWHRLNHRVPFLWRFHKVHHSDVELDASTALRFHTGEIVLSTLLRMVVVPLLGITIAQVAVYETILMPIILLHHSNVRMPRRLDNVLRWIIVTPYMHWVHHSDQKPETDSNYSSIFSVWDRLFKSFRFREEPREIQFGLGLREEEWRPLRGFLALPFRQAKKE
ncbi:MAG: sterol desaturase family protein [Candidatus Hydrogenedentes bacterium]|nr:sterol desaturase family protein [Candidatus Hydrogenedentota bacterium]